MPTEPICNEENRRFTLFPIKYHSLFELYKKQLSAFWKAEEIDFSNDYNDYLQLSDDEKHFIEMNLAFFAASDGIVNFNLSTRFLQDVKIIEAQVAYTYQMMMENVHSEVYSLMLDNIVRDPVKKEYLFNSIETVKSVKMMADWAFKWIHSDKSFAHRVIAFAVIEGIFFSGAFASIFWIKKYKASGRRFLDGLIKSNEFIARDEGLHTEFACAIYSLLENKLPFEEVKSIVSEGVEVAKNFVNDALPVRLIGMNEESMRNYIEYVADRLLVVLGYKKVYNKTNPFSFMETIGMLQKTNFFETRPTEYQSAHVFNKDSKIDYSNEDF
jgi:ribonucleoside-diphosphate reductase beta chain